MDEVDWLKELNVRQDVLQKQRQNLLQKRTQNADYRERQECLGLERLAIATKRWQRADKPSQ